MWLEFLVIGIGGGTLLILYILARRKEVEDGWKIPQGMRPFYQIAIWLYDLLKPRALHYFSKLNAALGRLHPGRSIAIYEREFFVKKLVLMLQIYTVSLVIVLLFSYKNAQDEGLIIDNKLYRGDENTASYTVTLDAQVGEETYENIEIQVGPRVYTKEEFDQILPEFCSELEKEFLGNNPSLEEIKGKVYMPEQLKNYPFVIRWQCSDWGIINRKGEIENGVSPEGSLVIMKALIQYRQYEASHQFGVCVYPPNLTFAEQIRLELLERIQEEEERSKEEEAVPLPMNVNGMQVTWTEKKSKQSIYLLLFLIASLVAIFLGQDRDLYKQVDERNKELLLVYPEIISKITLFVGAGMSLRSAFQKIAMEYQKKRTAGEPLKFAYEEIVTMVKEMECGVEEIVAYRNYGRRCHLQEYVKFASLLEQNVRMGGKGFIDQLQREAQDAFENRKSHAEKLGEQAGTKLMAPMFMMLIIVVAMIMIPALSGM